MGHVRIRHSSHDFGWQSSHSVDLAGWQAKMASTEIWIPWRNAHKPHIKIKQRKYLSKWMVAWTFRPHKLHQQNSKQCCEEFESSQYCLLFCWCRSGGQNVQSTFHILISNVFLYLISLFCKHYPKEKVNKNVANKSYKHTVSCLGSFYWHVHLTVCFSQHISDFSCQVQSSSGVGQSQSAKEKEASINYGRFQS